MSKAKVIKLTYDPIRTLKTHKVDPAMPLAELVELLKADWELVHQAVGREIQNRYAMAFAEVYDPEYDDEKSGELTIALDAATGRSAKAVEKPENKPKAKSKAKPKAAKPKAAPKPKAKGKGSKADKVRELIAANKPEGQDAVIQLAIDTLGMPKAQARTYVRNNWDKVTNDEGRN